MRNLIFAAFALVLTGCSGLKSIGHAITLEHLDYLAEKGKITIELKDTIVKAMGEENNEQKETKE